MVGIQTTRQVYPQELTELLRCPFVLSHAIDRSPADAVDPGKVAGGLAVGQALAGLGTLHVVDPELAAHLHAVFAGDGATFTRPS